MKRNYIFLLFLLNLTIINAQCWQFIDAGFSHTVGIKSDGTLWTWGLNSNGQLGDGTNTNKNIPTQITNENNWQLITAETNHTIALKTNGTLWAWGNNVYGQLGDGTNTNKNIPTQIGIDSNWQFISSGGGDHAFALKTDGTLWGWGDNFSGQLGDNTNNSKNIPTQIGNSTDWAIISVGSDHTIALKTNGTLWAWGKNSFGQLGDGTLINKKNPTQIGTANNWEFISTSNNHTIAKKTDGTLWAWGLNDNGQLGDGTSINKNIPTQINSDNNWQNAVAGGGHTIALKTDGSLWSWGLNNAGQLGNDTSTNFGIPNDTPIQITTTTDWQNIYAGANHTIALKTDGTFWAWGNNYSGQYGDGTNVSVKIPTFIDCSTLNVNVLNVNSVFFKIYPNPTRNLLYILDNNIKSIENVKIIEINGKNILEQFGDINQVNVEQLQQGIYIIQITIEGIKYQNKFIKL